MPIHMYSQFCELKLVEYQVTKIFDKILDRR